jgi:hypothetical protein
MVPTTISDKAVEMRNQIEIRLAISARPSHSAASAHTLVMIDPVVAWWPRHTKALEPTPVARDHAWLARPDNAPGTRIRSSAEND